MGLSIRPIPSIHQVFKWWEGLNAQQKMATAQERHPLVCFAMDPIETFTSEAYPKHNLCCDNAPFAYSPASPQKTYVLYASLRGLVSPCALAEEKGRHLRLVMTQATSGGSRLLQSFHRRRDAKAEVPHGAPLATRYDAGGASRVGMKRRPPLTWPEPNGEPCAEGLRVFQVKLHNMF